MENNVSYGNIHISICVYTYIYKYITESLWYIPEINTILCQPQWNKQKSMRLQRICKLSEVTSRYTNRPLEGICILPSWKWQYCIYKPVDEKWNNCQSKTEDFIWANLRIINWKVLQKALRTVSSVRRWRHHHVHFQDKGSYVKITYFT